MGSPASGPHGIYIRWNDLFATYGEELARIRRENATRVPCGHCGVPILPANLARHESYHKDD